MEMVGKVFFIILKRNIPVQLCTSLHGYRLSVFVMKQLVKWFKRDENELVLPAYQPTIPPAISFTASTRATDTAVDSLSSSDPLRLLVEFCRQNPTKRAVFLDVELMAESRHQHPNDVDFVKSNANEFAIMYALYPDHMKSVPEAIDLFALLISVPDSLIYRHLEEGDCEWIGGFMGRRSRLRDLVDRVKRQRQTLCAMIKDDKQTVLDRVLPLMDKGRTLEETINNMTLLAQPVTISAKWVKKGSILTWRTKRVPIKLLLLPRHLLVLVKSKDLRLHVSIDAVRVREISGGVVLCVDHLGIVMTLECNEQDCKSLMTRLCTETKRIPVDGKVLTVDEDNSNWQTLPKHQSFIDTIQWPEPILITNSNSNGKIPTISTIGSLYKFTNNSWEPLGRVTVSVETVRSQCVLVARGQETGVVRLCHNLITAPDTIEVYSNSFSILDKTLHQIKLKDTDCIQQLRDLIDYISITRTELSLWRDADQIPNEVLVFALQVQVKAVKVNNAEILEWPSGSLNLLKSGKFEYNYGEGVLIGWIHQGSAKVLRDDLISCHGAISVNERVQWCTLTIANLPLEYCIKVVNDLDTDLHSQLHSYQKRITVTSVQSEENDLMLSDIFTEPSDQKVQSGKEFEQTPIGRLWTFGLDTFI